MLKALLPAVLLLVGVAGTSVAESPLSIGRHVISGADLQIVVAALEGMGRNGHGLHAPLQGYEIRLAEEGNLYVVHFTDPDRPEGIRGSSPNMQEFSVELRRDNLDFIRWVGWR